ncbi:MAG: tripartite tricarboxylate transporter substrate-binding protein, partial [Dehalococcoidia bacterium]|nr:tripartite tricarboxylate transporter substrate-binding protein [Dehalococcoidia bacterium]
FDAATWFGFLAPAGTPKEVVARLNAEFNKALQQPELRRKLADQGAETTLWHGTVVPNRQWSVASTRALVRHDVVALRGAGALNGYWSDLSRVAHVGEPLVRPARLTRALADILARVVALIRPGLPIAELARRHYEALAAAGLPTQAAAESRGVGLELGELPVVHPTASGVLEVGHVIAIAAPARDLNWGDVEIAEVVVVTPTGAEPLSTLPWDIIATRG